MPKRRNTDDEAPGSTPRKSRRTGQTDRAPSSPAQTVTPSNRRSILKAATPTRANGAANVQETPSSLRKVLFQVADKDGEEDGVQTPVAIRNDRSARKKSVRALQREDDNEDSQDEEIRDDGVAREILDGEQSDESEDEEAQAPSSSAVTTPKRRGRPPGRKRERTPSPPPNLPPHELYFFQNRTGANKTSANTLSSHLLLNHEDYYTQINSLSDPHEADIKRLHALHERAFDQWTFELSQNFSLCLYGYGSKRKLATDFASHLYSQNAKPPRIVIINCYTPGLTLMDIFKAIYAAAAGSKASATLPSNPEVLATMTIDHLNTHPPSQPLYIILHSLDYPNLRGKPTTYALLSTLASHASIKLIATCDNPKFGLLWTSALQKAFRWLYHDATTFEPYTVELDVVEEVNQLLGRGRRRLGGKDGVAYVLQSLPENARNLFRILVAEQLALVDAEPSAVAGADVSGFDDEDVVGAEDDEVAARAQGTPSRRGRGSKGKAKAKVKAVVRPTVSAPEGVEYRTLYNKAVEEFVCSSELNFRTLLKEFHDHQMIESRKDALGTERLVVPFGKEELEGVLEELV